MVRRRLNDNWNRRWDWQVNMNTKGWMCIYTHTHTHTHTLVKAHSHICVNGLMKLNALRQNCSVKLLYEYIWLEETDLPTCLEVHSRILHIRMYMLTHTHMHTHIWQWDLPLVCRKMTLSLLEDWQYIILLYSIVSGSSNSIYYYGSNANFVRLYVCVYVT